MNYLGTLEDLLDEKRERKNLVLNALDIKMGGASVPPPPQYQYKYFLFLCFVTNLLIASGSMLASNEQAWQETRDLPEIVTGIYHNDETEWATAANRHAVSWLHEDDWGSGTSSKPIVGMKYWVVVRPKAGADNGSAGDMGSIHAFGQIGHGYSEREYSAGHAYTDLWDYEGVLLCPGDIL
jgi:hypothetical protein